MPSPFPGMDPYIERPVEWRHFHNALIAAMSRDLNRRLPPGFRCRIDERLYVQPGDQGRAPDWAVVRLPQPFRPTGGAAATLALPQLPGTTTPPQRFVVEDEEVREPYLRILAADREREAVAVLEMLSPSNKVPDGPGHADYKRKQHELLHSGTHLIEIDLLRGGAHTVALSREKVWREYGPFDYLAVLHRAGAGSVFEGWPLTLRDRLPQISVPLSDRHPDLPLDLQALFEEVYDTDRYAEELDYSAEPTPRLSPSDAAWVDTRFRERGLQS